jgi:hypothetical protein
LSESFTIQSVVAKFVSTNILSKYDINLPQTVSQDGELVGKLKANTAVHTTAKVVTIEIEVTFNNENRYFFINIIIKNK